MSSLELNKIAGAVLVGGMVALVSGILADLLVEPEPLETEAVVIAGAEEAGEAAPAAEEEAGLEPVTPLLASADVSAGETVARRCAACHTFQQGEANKVGPNLWNVVGAPHAHQEDFSYSDAIASIEGPWNYEALNAFLASPREYAPGTKMTFAGLPDVQDRADLIAWLRTLSDDPQPLPEPTAAAEPAAEAAEGAATDAAEGTEVVPAEEAEITKQRAPAAAAQPGEESGPTPVTGEDEGEAGATQEAAAPAADDSIQGLLAAADPAAGETVARRCAACHSFEQGGPNKIGPNLWNVVGAPTAHVEDYNYSDAIAGLDGEWTYENLDAFLASPREYAPGTKMTFAGIRDAEDRADLIAWLRTLSDDPQPLP